MSNKPFSNDFWVFQIKINKGDIKEKGIGTSVKPTLNIFSNYTVNEMNETQQTRI